MSTHQAARDVPGALLEGRYRLEHELGAGGMGTVWSAEDLQLRRRVAIKFPSHDCRRSEAALARFAREARNAGKVRSPHVVQVFGQGASDDGIPYIVMELLEGHDLADQLVHCGAASLALVYSVVEQACRALSRAHQAGVIHRDIKPANVFVTPEGDGGLFVRVLDFGIAKDLGTKAVVLTQSKVGMGSVLYMSPEQFADAKSVTPQTDLWSLGVVAYELLTGRHPFLTDTPQEFVRVIAAGAFPPATSVLTTLPSAIDGFFRRALQPDPQQRFATADEMSSALARIVRSHASGVVMKTSELGSKDIVDAAPRAGSVLTSKTAVGADGARNKRVGAMVAAAVLLAGGAAWWRNGLEEPSTVAASMSGEQVTSADLRQKIEEQNRKLTDALAAATNEAEKRRLEMDRELDRMRRDADDERTRHHEELRRIREESVVPRPKVGANVRTPPAPAPVAPKPVVSPSAFLPASATMHTAIVQAIARSNAAEVRALRTLDGAPLVRTHSGKALSALQSEILTLRGKHEFRANALAGTSVQSVQVSRDQRSARVRTTETWEESWYDRNTSLCLRHVHQRPVPQTVLLRWVNGGWVIDDVAFDATPAPQIVRCHYQ
ncbi:MAG: protein kinase [Polyangiales bacterium]